MVIPPKLDLLELATQALVDVSLAISKQVQPKILLREFLSQLFHTDVDVIIVIAFQQDFFEAHWRIFQVPKLLKYIKLGLLPDVPTKTLDFLPAFHGGPRQKV